MRTESEMRYTCPYFFFQAEDGIRDKLVTGVQTCALPIYRGARDARDSPVTLGRSGNPDVMRCCKLTKEMGGPEMAPQNSADVMRCCKLTKEMGGPEMAPQNSADVMRCCKLTKEMGGPEMALQTPHA